MALIIFLAVYKGNITFIPSIKHSRNKVEVKFDKEHLAVEQTIAQPKL